MWICTDRIKFVLVVLEYFVGSGAVSSKFQVLFSLMSRQLSLQSVDSIDHSPGLNSLLSDAYHYLVETVFSIYLKA